MKHRAKREIRTILGIGCAVLLTACMADIRVCMTDVNPQGWNEGVSVTYPNEDTTALRDLYVVIRHDERAAGTEIPVTIQTLTPDSLTCEETIPIRIPPRRFDRAVERNSSYFEKETPYRLRTLLHREGVYRFRFTPGGESQAEGISAIGIRFRSSAEK